MLCAVWKMISLFLALGAFLVVGVIGLISGEDLIWSVGKAVGSFFACWVTLGVLGNMLSTVVEKQDVAGTGAVIDDKG